jgi:hypothetical protein
VQTLRSYNGQFRCHADVAELTDRVRAKTGATYQQSMQAVIMVFEHLEKNLPAAIKDRLHLKLEVCMFGFPCT